MTYKIKTILLTSDYEGSSRKTYIQKYSEDLVYSSSHEISRIRASPGVVNLDGKLFFSLYGDITHIHKYEDDGTLLASSPYVQHSIASVNARGDNRVCVLARSSGYVRYIREYDASDLSYVSQIVLPIKTYESPVFEDNDIFYMLNRTNKTIEKWSFCDAEKVDEKDISSVGATGFTLGLAGDNLLWSDRSNGYIYITSKDLAGAITQIAIEGIPEDQTIYYPTVCDIKNEYFVVATNSDKYIGGGPPYYEYHSWLQKYSSSGSLLVTVEVHNPDSVEYPRSHKSTLLQHSVLPDVPEITTEAASSIGINHAKGNGTTYGENITERGFEVKLAFSGTLYEYINRSIAGFEGDLTWDIVNKWNGDLVKTITETGSFSEGAFVDDLGRFPVAVASDKLFAEETYDYRAYAIIDGDTYYGDWVEFTTNGYPSGEGPDDIISPEVPIEDPIPPDDPFVWPEIEYPPWVWPEIDIPPFEFDPTITFGKTFGAFLRGLDTKKDWKTLREKCIIYQENMNAFALVTNHNNLVIKNLVIDIISYIDGDVYPSDLELVESSQQLTPLYLEEISPNGFKDIINDFRLKDVCNVHTLNLNFKKILSSLNSLYESDYVTEPISYNTIEYIDIQPTAKRMILQLEDMRKKYKEVRRLTARNMKRIFTYV